VEGAHLRASRNDRTDYSIQVIQYISRRDAHHLKPFSFQNCVASLISQRLITHAMLFSIDFDN